jgi:hypothetical protein
MAAQKILAVNFCHFKKNCKLYFIVNYVNYDYRLDYDWYFLDLGYGVIKRICW